MRATILLLLLASITFADVKFGRFHQYVASFSMMAKQQHVKVDLNNLRIQFDALMPSDYLGLCYDAGTKYALITINEDNWAKASYSKREYIIWHEMGHCVLNRGHLDMLKPDFHPVSIMYPDSRVVEDTRYYNRHRQEYIEELFHPKYIDITVKP